MAPVGRGGAGIVWRARDDLLDRNVAVKEIARLASLDADELADTYERALREARAAARISHSGVAAVYDVVTEGGCPYVVMELIGGRSLSGLIEDEGPLAPADVAEIGRQVLAALMAGHAAGVLHRDLKPGNVLITPGGRAVLTDFGIASLTGDLSMTRTGVVVGTPGYLATERIRGDPASPAADLWSLGATLYAAACGRGPFDGYDGAIPTMYKIATEEPRELTADGPLRAIVSALLSRDPRLRPSSTDTAQVLDAAVEVLAGSVPAVADPGEPAAERAGDRRALRTVTSGLLTAHPATDAGIAVRARRRGQLAGVLLIGLAGVAAAAVIVLAVTLGHPAPRAGSAALGRAPAVATVAGDPGKPDMGRPGHARYPADQQRPVGHSRAGRAHRSVRPAVRRQPRLCDADRHCRRRHLVRSDIPGRHPRQPAGSRDAPGRSAIRLRAGYR
jgi:eukaryotic-like serine/threonine-protein kinase